MPIGIAAMLLLGPALPAIGWQHLWLANAAAACTLAVGLRFVLPVEMDAASSSTPPLSGVVAVLLRTAKALGLEVPPKMLALTDEVLE
jgi:hypothetical protein